MHEARDDILVGAADLHLRATFQHQEACSQFCRRHHLVGLFLGKLEKFEVGDGKVTLPLGIVRIAGGQAFRDGQIFFEIAQGRGEVVLGRGKIAELLIT